MLVCLSIFFIARVDIPVLAPGIGRLGPIELDGSWFAFRKDILLHEAHRHVFIERFGQLCLLKLRAPKSFGVRACSAWRLLFVLSVMPWLRKYRVLDGSIEEAEEIIADAEEKLEEETDGARCDEMKRQLAAMKSTKAHKSEECLVKDAAIFGGDNRDTEIDALRKRNAYLESKLAEMIDHKSECLDV